MTSEYGPFASYEEARSTRAAAALRAACDANPGTWEAEHLRVMTSACEEAGVDLGAFDLAPFRQLAMYEPFNAVVMAGIIHRVFEAGKAGAFTEADIKSCRHCGGPLIPCRRSHDLPVCKGWLHAAWLSMGPVGPHYCEGRSVNPSGEPEEAGDGNG